MAVLSSQPDPQMPSAGTMPPMAGPAPTALDQPAAAVSNTDAPTTGDAGGRGGWRFRPWWLLVILGVVAAAVGAVMVLDQTAETETAEPTPVRAVEAITRDLAETTDLPGSLQYAEVRTVRAAGPGTVTSLPDESAELRRGDAVLEIDAQPVVLIYGTTPLYRPMQAGTEGDDVLLLEQNLASLGYHVADTDGRDEVDAGFVVDGTWDGATTAAVQRWQDDLGAQQDGMVLPTDVVVVPGPSAVASVTVEVGTQLQAGVPMLDLNLNGSVNAFYSAHAGEVELLLAPGATPATGDVIYTVDEQPKTVLVTSEDMERNLYLGVVDGPDVEAVEEMFEALGYTAGGDLTVDDQWDAATSEALADWEDDLQEEYDEFIADGVLAVSELVVINQPLAVGEIAATGDVLGSGAELYSSSTMSDNRVVVTRIDVAEQEKLSLGTSTAIVFPDGSAVAGLVTRVSTTSVTDPTDPAQTARLPIEISLDSVPESAAAFNELDVEVQIVDELAVGVTVVPASALVATGDGGYAVEMVDGATTRFIAVEPGLFADGLVEVQGITAGTAVVVP